MRKIIFLIVVICLSVFGFLVIKGSWNTWGCSQGEWIMFGRGDKPKPEKSCGIPDTIKGKILTYTENYRINSKFLNTENYSDQGLDKLPSELLFMTGAIVVKLDNNNLSFLDKDFFALTKIRELYLDHNNFSKLPVEWGKLSELEKLDLSHNNITDIPKEFGNLKKLRRLDLSRNKLKDFPEEFYLLKDNLESLDIFKNNFDTDFIIILQEKLPNTTINF